MMGTHAAALTAETKTALAAAAADLDLICRLFDREIDADLLATLAAGTSRDWFLLQTAGADAKAGFDLIDGYLAANPDGDALAADFADCHLTFAKRIAPNESFWLTEDHLERQEPMFSVRSWYAHYGLKAQNWRQRADDHLVCQLEFVAALLKDGRPHAVADAGRFLDRHLLRWSADFLGGVARRAETPFYAGLALVTAAQIEAVRALIELVTGEARTTAIDAAPEQPPGPAENCAYNPAAGPGW